MTGRTVRTAAGATAGELEVDRSRTEERLLPSGVLIEGVSIDGVASVEPAGANRLLTTLMHAFEPGQPVSLYEAQMALRDDYMHAETTLVVLTELGELDRPSAGLWVRRGAAPNPYLLAARISYPYTFVRGTALALLSNPASMPVEVMVCCPDGFRTFAYAGATYRSVGEWFDDDITRVLVGTRPAAGRSATPPLGAMSSDEPVAVTTLERTLVDYMRDPADAADVSDVVAALPQPPLLDPRGVLRALDHTTDPRLPGRVAMLLDAVGVAQRQPDLMRAVRSRSGVIGRRMG